jgi:hypothetical protein
MNTQRFESVHRLCRQRTRTHIVIAAWRMGPWSGETLDRMDCAAVVQGLVLEVVVDTRADVSILGTELNGSPGCKP